MRSETIAIHGGYDVDPTTKAVAVPIYQTVAYAFDSADHAAALFAHVLPSQGVNVRFAESDQPDAIERLIDDKTRGVFCESVANPAGNICDLEAFARVAHNHGVPLIVDNTVATPILLRPIEYGA